MEGLEQKLESVDTKNTRLIDTNGSDKKHNYFIYGAVAAGAGLTAYLVYKIFNYLLECKYKLEEFGNKYILKIKTPGNTNHTLEINKNQDGNLKNKFC